LFHHFGTAGREQVKPNEINTLHFASVELKKPITIKTDNGSEFIRKVMDKWAYERGVELDFSRPGKPKDNVMVESFNGRLRQECLNEHWFMNLQDARNKIEAWRGFYNEESPHSALKLQSVEEFALKNGSKPYLQNIKEPDLLTSEW
jgi:putative transposase